MAIGNLAPGNPMLITSTTLLIPRDGALAGFFCSTTSSGTVQLYDSATAATNNAITGVVTLTAGSWYSFNALYRNGLYVVVTGTATVTFITF